MSTIIHCNIHAVRRICQFFNKKKSLFPEMINSPTEGESLVEKRRFIYEQFMSENVFLTCNL